MKLFRITFIILLIIVLILTSKKISASSSANLAVILIRFNNSGNPTFTKEDVSQKMFTDINSVRNYYKEVSNDKLDLNGQVFDWITIPFNKPTQYNPANPIQIHEYFSSADSISNESGVNLNNFNYKFYVVTDPVWGCKSPDGGAIDNFGFSSHNNLYNYIHELGHVFGLGHANFLNCHSKSIDYYQNCTEIEYGDPYDVMGGLSGGGISHLNAPHKINLGWLPYPQMQKILTDGEYQLDAIELNSNNIQALRIPKPDTREYYIVEYRQPIGIDQSLKSILFEGVSIRIWNNNPGQPSRLINPVLISGVSSNYRPLLYDNEEFYDQINNIRIKQVSHNQNSALISVTVSTAPMIGFKVEGQHINQYGEPFSLSNQLVTINRLDGSQFNNTSNETPLWNFNDLEIGYYSIIASVIPGYRIVSSICNNCNFHSSYSMKNSRTLTFSPTDNYTNISFKYLSNKGDINNDEKINNLDISSLNASYNSNNIESDLNNDNIVNIFDYSQLLKNYGDIIQ
jgi:hypothetical protein